MQNRVEKKFNAFGFLDSKKRILVGVSGGADSIVLAYLLTKFGYNIGIAHCHFNLRKDDADTDQDFTKQFASQLNVPFFTVKFNTKTYADTRKISIQMAARNLRYFWFEKICKENNFQQIAVGTHLTDNIETFIFNSIRGTGLSGLRGIKPLNNKIIRPLLQVSKSEIYHYATAEGLNWREDLSNQSIKYHRNKIRQQIIPVLEEINPNFEATYQRNFKRLSRLDSFVIQQIEQIWNDWALPNAKGFSLTISDLINHEFTDVILNYKLQPLGFNSSQVNDLVNALDNQPGTIFSSKDYRIYLDRDTIFVQPIRFFSMPNQYSITEFIGELTQPIHLAFKDLHAKDVSFTKSKNIVFLDFDKLKFPLTLRQWKAGDRLAPFGMIGIKKVSDLLIDSKIPLHEKDNIWVIESNSEICWVVGLRSSEKFKITDKTKRVYSISTH